MDIFEEKYKVNWRDVNIKSKYSIPNYQLFPMKMYFWAIREVQLNHHTHPPTQTLSESAHG